MHLDSVLQKTDAPREDEPAAAKPTKTKLKAARPSMFLSVLDTGGSVVQGSHGCFMDTKQKT